uniref:Uncharacterized protein n=1 Tax=Romanomermis culicivorax TaxID=13658 RepID=A0A915KH20_ROMCU
MHRKTRYLFTCELPIKEVVDMLLFRKDIRFCKEKSDPERTYNKSIGTDIGQKLNCRDEPGRKSNQSLDHQDETWTSSWAIGPVERRLALIRRAARLLLNEEDAESAVGGAAIEEEMLEEAVFSKELALTFDKFDAVEMSLSPGNFCICIQRSSHKKGTVIGPDMTSYILCGHNSSSQALMYSRYCIFLNSHIIIVTFGLDAGSMEKLGSVGHWLVEGLLLSASVLFLISFETDVAVVVGRPLDGVILGSIGGGDSKGVLGTDGEDDICLKITTGAAGICWTEDFGATFVIEVGIGPIARRPVNRHDGR